MSRNFKELLEKRWSLGNFVCVGLDSDMSKIPEHIQGKHGVSMKRVADITIPIFNRAIVEATHDLVCAYKPNLAFYAREGVVGILALRDTIADIHTIAPDILVILDAKVGDIDNSNEGYVSFVFNYLRADAVTVHPYLGREALQPFLDQKDKGIIVLCRTSNKGAGEFQDRKVQVSGQFGKEYIHTSSYVPMYQLVAHQVSNEWNTNGNCALVVGATYPDELRKVRGLVGDIPILIPGIGAQGGDLERSVRAGKDSRRKGMIINSSRVIIFASSGPDFAEAARRETIKLRDGINEYR